VAPYEREREKERETEREQERMGTRRQYEDAFFIKALMVIIKQWSTILDANLNFWYGAEFNPLTSQKQIVSRHHP